MENDDSEEVYTLDTQLWWALALVLSSAVLLGRRGFVHYVEQGKSAAEVFALRARSLPYITLWAVIAIAAVVLSFFHDTAEAVGVTGVVVAEFVAVCLWRDYFGNSDFVTQYVRENKQRLRYLLTLGLGMNATEFEGFCRTVEDDLVEFWKRNLRNKKWSCLNDEEMGKLLFSSGTESGKVMTRALWEGALFDVAAFMREWLSGVPNVRVPSQVIGPMYSGTDADAQALLCVGIILANETRDVREARAQDPTRKSGRQFSAARIARRKTAAEGILHWPNCLAQVDDVKIRSIVWNTDDLYILRRGQKESCSENRIPISVMYSLTEIIEAGYLRVSPQGSIDASVTFKYSNMVFKKDEWNQLRTIERKPFRYITSATWMAGDPAFMVEQREITGSAAELDGSGFLQGVLKLQASVDVTEQQLTWLQTASLQQQSHAGIWGRTEDFIRPEPVCFLNWPMLWMIQFAWAIFGFLARLREGIIKMWKPPISTTLPAVPSQTASLFVDTFDRLMHRSRRTNPSNGDHSAEADDIRVRYQSQHDRELSMTTVAMDEERSQSGPSDADNIV